jgi:hypothetical protein
MRNKGFRFMRDPAYRYHTLQKTLGNSGKIPGKISIPREKLPKSEIHQIYTPSITKEILSRKNISFPNYVLTFICKYI